MAMSEKKYSIIGKRLPNVDAMKKCTGSAKYADDLKFSRMLYGKLLGSPHPHARIRSIDTQKAESLEGVRAVVTGRDLPRTFSSMLPGRDMTALAAEKVRFIGDPLAAVAAVSEPVAEKALELIEVDYEPLAPVLTIEEALIPKKPRNRIHSFENRTDDVDVAISFEFGEVEAGFNDSELVFEDSFFYQGSTHFPMEQLAVVAQWLAPEKLTVWSPTQMPHFLQLTLSHVLEIPMGRVRVISPTVGGGFGGKDRVFAYEICAAKLSMLTGQPVKITLSREECFYAQGGRHPARMSLRTGLKKDGTIRAMDYKAFLDGGGYDGVGLIALDGTGMYPPLTYKIPAYKFEGARVFTNKPTCVPKRGFGGMEGRFALEVHLDKIAEKLGIDPVELRLKQLAEPNSVTVNGLRIGSMGLGECIRKVAERAQWKKKFRRLPRGRGIGIAAGAIACGNLSCFPYSYEMPLAATQIRIDRGGKVTLFAGLLDIGQGSNSVLTYTVAEEFGLDPADITVVSGDTSLVPMDFGSFSGRGTMASSSAAFEACRAVKEKLLKAAGEAMEVPADDLEMAQGQVRSKTYPEQAISFAECVEHAETKFGTLGAVGFFRPPPDIPAQHWGFLYAPSIACSYGAAIVELTCDPDSAQVKVDKVWAAHDCGRAMSRLLMEGQMEGGIYFSLGEALMEEQTFAKNGLHKTPSMLDYKTLTSLEIPEIETIIVESNDPRSPYGVKEASQALMTAIVPAVANALYDAVGVRIYEVPITPDKILRAMQKRLKPPRVPRFDFPEPVRPALGEKHPFQVYTSAIRP